MVSADIIDALRSVFVEDILYILRKLQTWGATLSVEMSKLAAREEEEEELEEQPASNE